MVIYEGYRPYSAQTVDALTNLAVSDPGSDEAESALPILGTPTGLLRDKRLKSSEWPCHRCHSGENNVEQQEIVIGDYAATAITGLHGIHDADNHP